MIIHLSKAMERFVHDAVRAGLYSNQDEVVDDALTRLRQTMPQASGRKRSKASRRARDAAQQPVTKPMNKDEFHRHLIEIGMMSHLPDRAADFDDPADEPIPTKGEPLSRTVIRERR